MLTPNTILQNRYRIIRLLGQGGLSAVYEAYDERLDMLVALKETFFKDNPQLLKQFEFEARLLGQLNHPAIPKVSDHFAEGEGHFLVMQLIPGDDLQALLQRRGAPFPLADVVSWAGQAAGLSISRPANAARRATRSEFT